MNEMKFKIQKLKIDLHFIINEELTSIRCNDTYIISLFFSHRILGLNIHFDCGLAAL